MTIKCRKCHIVKPEAGFWKGQANCIDCLKEYMRSPAYKAIRKKYRQSEKGKAAARRSWISEKGKAWSRAKKFRYPLQTMAKNAVIVAVRQGKIPRIKTQTCFNCGNTANHYHHYLGHSKEHWLDVIPLCIPCHNQAHNR